MSNGIKAGDTVQLKSGGPIMTVQRIEPHDKEMTAWCQWFDGVKPMSGRFTLTSLTVTR